jgi:hypothetical protein
MPAGTVTANDIRMPQHGPLNEWEQEQWERSYPRRVKRSLELYDKPFVPGGLILGTIHTKAIAAGRATLVSCWQDVIRMVVFPQ